MKIGRDTSFWSILEETKQVLMNIVEHAATLRECIEQGTPPSQVSHKLHLFQFYYCTFKVTNFEF